MRQPLLRMVFIVWALAATSAIAVYGQSDCDAAVSAIKHAREKLADAPSTDDLQEVLSQLSYATDVCPNHGDAWYFRAKVEQKLGKPFDYSMKNAEKYRSQALRNGVDPFSSSTPSAPARPNQTAPISNIRDTVRPRIKIISPPVARGQGASLGSKVTVIGEATDESGVSEVTVRDQVAQLDTSGRFSAEVRLSVGDNQIVVTATDIYGNRAEETVTIKRDVISPSPIPEDLSVMDSRFYALLIGVEKYLDKRITPLDNPLKDVLRLYKVLTEQYDFNTENVTKLSNPTRQEIFKVFKELRGKLSANDSLLIFYAGHGDWSEEKKQGYWLPSDAEIDVSSQWFSNSDLQNEISAIKTKHVLLITDACFAGSLFKERAIPKDAPRAIQELFKLPSRKAMTSGALKPVSDKSDFLDYLIKRLEENQDKYITALKLFASLQEAVTNNSPTQQTPLYGTILRAGDEGGEFVFARQKMAAPK